MIMSELEARGPEYMTRNGSRHRVFATGEPETLVALGGDGVAMPLVAVVTADIGHEHPRLAGNVGAHVPGVRQRIERAVGHLVDVVDPFGLGPRRGLDP